MKEILSKRIIGIAGGEHGGKTMSMFNMIDYCKEKYNTQIWCYFYHQEYKTLVKGVNFFATLDELETITNSFIFIDEFAELFQLSNRHFKHQVERVFNMIMHNNNVLVLCGVPAYYKQFIATRIKQWVLKSIKYKDCVNGSALKLYIQSLTGDFVGATQINIPIDKMLVSGEFIKSNYIRKYDKKTKNVNIFIKKTKKSSNIGREVGK